MASYRMAISGCGTAGQHVARVAVADGRGDIVGLYDPIQKAKDIMAAEYPDAHIADTYADLLESEKPQVVVIAGPDHLHGEQAIAAANNGCHVLIEKPLAVTANEARDIQQAVERSGVTAMTDQTMRYLYPFGEMAKMARAGEVGDLFYLQGDYVHDMWSYYSPDGKDYTPWRADMSHPQNILLGGGCHPIDLILWTVDSDVKEVMCYSSKLSVPEFPSDDCYLVSIRFENDVIAKVHVSCGCSGHGMGDFLEIYGTNGTLSKGRLLRRDHDPADIPRPIEDAEVGGHGWGGSVVDFLDTLDGTIENPIPLRHGARTVAVCEAALISAKTGRPARVENV